MTNLATYRANKIKLNKEKVNDDLKRLEQLDSESLQLDLITKNSSHTNSTSYIQMTKARKEAMDDLKKDVRTAYGNEIADEAENASTAFGVDIFDE